MIILKFLNASIDLMTLKVQLFLDKILKRYQHDQVILNQLGNILMVF